jgi:hypothetical protein
MKKNLLSARVAFTGLLALAPFSAAAVIVDPAGGGSFTDLQTAIDTVPDGELLVLKSGVYEPVGAISFVVANKGLTIVADTGALVVLRGLQVNDLLPGRSVVVRGLTLGPTFQNFQGVASLSVSGADSTVWAEDCTILGGDGVDIVLLGQNTSGSPGASVDGGGSLTLRNCATSGGMGAPYSQFGGVKVYATAGGAGATVNNARLAVLGGSLTGGNGGLGQIQNSFFVGANGGNGLTVVGTGFAHLSGTALTGGSNGLGNDVSSDFAGDGLHVVGTSAHVWLRDSTLAAGTVVPAGTPGQAQSASAGTVITLSAPARSLSVTSPLREGQLGTLSIHGQQGDAVIVLIGLASDFVPLIGKQGVFALDPSVLLLPVSLGTITDPGGQLVLPILTPNLNPVLSGLTVPMQLLVTNPGSITIEGGSVVAWLDAAL